MLFSGPLFFVLTVVMAALVMDAVGLSVFWTIFAITLVVTTIVAVSRSIPRKER